MESISHRIENGVTRANRLARVRHRKLAACERSCGLTFGKSQRSSGGNKFGIRLEGSAGKPERSDEPSRTPPAAPPDAFAVRKLDRRGATTPVAPSVRETAARAAFAEGSAHNQDVADPNPGSETASRFGLVHLWPLQERPVSDQQIKRGFRLGFGSP